MPLLTVSLTAIPPFLRAWPMLESKNGANSGNCLSASTIYHTTQGRKHGFELQLGDRVLVNNGVYAPIRVLKNQGPALVLQFTLDDGTVFSCTPSHFVYTAPGRCQRASEVIDTLLDANGNEIRIVNRKEAYDNVVSVHTLEHNDFIVSDLRLRVSAFAACKCSKCQHIDSQIQYQCLTHPALPVQQLVQETLRKHGNHYHTINKIILDAHAKHFEDKKHQPLSLKDEWHLLSTAAPLMMC